MTFGLLGITSEVIRYQCCFSKITVFLPAFLKNIKKNNGFSPL
jgi:hypothetical protein